MTVFLSILVLLWASLALLGLINILTFTAHLRAGARTQVTTPSPAPRVALILPVKGVHDHLDAVLQGLLRLDYPNYRLIVVTEGEYDPATAFARRLSAKHPARIEVAVAGPAESGGQKVHNLRHALGLLGPADEAVCFADADAIPAPHWLTTLVAWLYIGRRPRVVSLYRWLIPEDGRLSSAFAAALNGAVATLGRSNRRNLPWGGAMIIRREDLDALGLPAAFEGILSDDLQLGRLVHEAGGTVKHPYPFFVASPIGCSWPELISFCRRQYTILYAYARPFWWLAAGALGLLAAGWGAALALALNGVAWAWGLLLAVYLVDLLRAFLRWRIGRSLLPSDARPGLARMAWIDGLLSPLAQLLHAGCIWSTLGRRTLVWAGIRYDLRDPQQVAILSRAPDALPPGPAPILPTVRKRP